MIHDVHGTHGVEEGRTLLPATAEITTGVKLLVLAGVLASIMQGGFVVGSSMFGRVWPSINSTKIELPPPTFGH